MKENGGIAYGIREVSGDGAGSGIVKESSFPNPFAGQDLQEQGNGTETADGITGSLLEVEEPGAVDPE